MKTLPKIIVLWLLRIAVCAAPAYSLHMYLQGEGSTHDTQWWLENVGYIAWALGSYMIIFLGSMAWAINWTQISLLVGGALGLMYFFFTRDVYSAFLSIPFFEKHHRMLPVVPYVYIVFIMLVATLLKTRHSKRMH